MNLKLKYEIIQSGLHQFEIANLADISEVRLSKIINGRIEPNHYERLKIAEALNIEPAELFGTNNFNFKAK
jgi:transcriptional regulator with XRE-family HTH domain